MIEDEWVENPDWHPDTAGIRTAWAYMSEQQHGQEPVDSDKEFDRWYSAEIRKAKAEALATVQVQAVLAYCERLELLGNGLAQCGDVKGSAGALASATGIRSVIEEAGA